MPAETRVRPVQRAPEPGRSNESNNAQYFLCEMIRNCNGNLTLIQSPFRPRFPMKIAIAQLNQTVGDLRGNLQRIKNALARAEKAGAELALFPELAITG